MYLTLIIQLFCNCLLTGNQWKIPSTRHLTLILSEKGICMCVYQTLNTKKKKMEFIEFM